MKWVILGCVIIAGALLTGCSERLTREGLLAREAYCLRCYCASNAVVAEAALLECVRYAQQCQEAGVKDILYDEVLARTYGRLYLVERHLGHSAEAEQYLQKYARFHAASSSLARRMGRPHGEMERLIEQKFDHGMQTAWRIERGTDATGRLP